MRNMRAVPDAYSNETKINHTKEPNKAHKSTLKEEILQVINEYFIEMLLDMASQNVQEALKKFQDIKSREYEKTQKQINEIIETLNKHQTETAITVNREINELRA
jgi:5,10-methylene-tetrahydrofolate dehydrogenase/methenyl tetrahydrofolate cyclohydrolase